jgi:polyisoprenoid-binding protein YceI
MQRRHFMKFAAVVMIALGSVASVVLAEQTLIADKSEIVYVSSQMGVSVDGSFSKFQAQVNLDPKQLQASSVSFAVDTSSVDFPSEDIRKELAKPDWLDTAHFPRAEFKSSRIRDLGGGRYEITGTLTIKGHAREVTCPVSLSQSGSTTFATGTLTIKRLQFGIGQGEWSDTSLVADDVQIKFKIALSGVGPV